MNQAVSWLGGGGRGAGMGVVVGQVISGIQLLKKIIYN